MVCNRIRENECPFNWFIHRLKSDYFFALYSNGNTLNFKKIDIDLWHFLF